MRNTFILLPILFSSLNLFAQFKDDNIKYRTVFIEDLCATLEKNPGYLLLDVRSPGEYADTSRFTSLNIGHLKNAVNIDINELDKRLSEIKNAVDKPVFVYCSHSQRSRRASAMLADSGFSKVYNINGGLTTFNLLKESGVPCAGQYYETGNTYQSLSPADIISLIKKDKNVFILDVRKDSVFKSISTDEALNAYGKINNAVNIPSPGLQTSLSKVPKDKTIIITDDAGSDAPGAAKILTDAGYKNIFLSFNGMYTWSNTPESELPEKNKFWSQSVPYGVISSEEFSDMLAAKKEVVIVDVRNAEEFRNQSKDSWRNRGNIKNAINIPFSEFNARLNELNAYKNKTIILHHFSNQQDGYQAAKKLAENGFTNVKVLSGGIWSLLWKAANIKGKSHLKDLVENIPAENL